MSTGFRKNILHHPPNNVMAARQGAISIEEFIKCKVFHYRRWKQTKLSKRQQNWPFQFSIMTYNILSQTAVENHRYLYKHCNNSFLQEDYRISRILPEILKSKSDIICLQEVEQHLFDNRIKHVFDSNGFESIFKKRTGHKNDGCAILWRKKKFDLLRHTSVEFIAEGSDMLNRDNVGLIAVLKPNHPKSGNTQLHIATTHLLFNPKRGDIKLCQLRWLLAELERMALKEVRAEERFYHPVILCGDFNIEPRSPLYQFIESGFLDVADVMSGDLSGQAKGKRKGRLVRGEQLSLYNVGISKASRFEETPEDDNSCPSESSKPSKSGPVPCKESNAHCNSVGINSAVGTSNDPRWLTTLLAIGQEQLAAEISSRIQSQQITSSNGESSSPKVANNNSPNRIPTQANMGSNNVRFSHDFTFVPVYKFRNADAKDMPITTMTGNDYNTVDHIFYTVRKKNGPTIFTENQLRLLELYSLMRMDEINDLGGLPNAYLGSDHISLNAKFALCFKR